MFFKRKLNLEKIHQLYLALLHCLPHQEEKLLIDQIEKMMLAAEPGTLEKSLMIMYPKIDLKKENDLSAILLFVKGIKDNKFFEYVNSIEGLSARNKRDSQNNNPN